MADISGQVLLDRLGLLVDSKSGILRSVESFALRPGYDDLAYGFAAVAGRSWVLQPRACRVRNELGELAGYGFAFDEITARIRAMCEAVERYCAVMCPTDGVVATASELSALALDPRRLPQCSARERARASPSHRLRPPDLDTPEEWVTGYSLTRGKPILVPASAVHLGLAQPLSEHLVLPESTGYATGTDYGQAVLAGLCEVVERDSIALWWLHQLPMPRILRGAEISSSLEEALRRLERAGIRTRLFDFTTDVGVPVIGLIQTSRTGRPNVVVAAACRVDAVAAAIRVVEEAAGLHIALDAPRNAFDRESLLAGGPQAPEAFADFYANPDGIDRFAFALETACTTMKLPSSVAGVDPLSSIVIRLGELGMEVIAVDVTMPEIRDMGLVVVRTLVPELMRISFAHGIRYLGHPRLYSAPRTLGYGERIEDMITHDPIPFA